MPADTAPADVPADSPNDAQTAQTATNWVQRKTCDFGALAALLAETQATNAFTNGGPAVRRLEHEVRARFGIDGDKAVVATCSGTAALWAVKSAIDLFLARMHRFATQAFTFPSSAQGPLADSVVVDIDEGGGLSLARADEVGDAVDGIVVTNVFGCVVDIARYTRWARERGKILIFDNAATPFTVYGGKNSLNYGDAAICSLHHTKTVGFGEGGFVVCGPGLEPYVRRVLNFGIDNGAANPQWDRFGGNYKMSDMAAAAILQFWHRCAERTLARTRAVREEVEQARPRGRPLRLFPSHHDAGTTPVHTCIPVLVEDSDEVLARLRRAGVMARKYYTPLARGCATTDRVFAEIVCVPCHADVSPREVAAICSLL